MPPTMGGRGAFEAETDNASDFFKKKRFSVFFFFFFFFNVHHHKILENELAVWLTIGWLLAA